MSETDTSASTDHAWQDEPPRRPDPTRVMVGFLLLLVGVLVVLDIVLLTRVHLLRQDVAEVGGAIPTTATDTTTVVEDSDTCRLLGALLARQGGSVQKVFSGQQDMTQCETSALEGAQSVKP